MSGEITALEIDVRLLKPIWTIPHKNV